MHARYVLYDDDGARTSMMCGHGNGNGSNMYERKYRTWDSTCTGHTARSRRCSLLTT